MSAAMSKGEREDLQRLIRQRERDLKSAAKQRSAELLADFENTMAAEFHIGDDAVWEQLVREAQAEVDKIARKLASRCRQLGIPDQFAPRLTLGWQHRGYSNALDKRVAELRMSARAEVEAMERRALAQIELASVDAQTKLAVSGLTSDGAIAFVQALPTVDSLMPSLSYSAIAGESDSSPVAQLVTPNAIRQRRYRERHAALRDAAVTPALALRDNGDDDAGEETT